MTAEEELVDIPMSDMSSHQAVDSEEELEDIPMSDKVVDPFFQQRIMLLVNRTLFIGYVEDIDMGKFTKDRLYRVRYHDGDLEHLTADELRVFARPFCS